MQHEKFDAAGARLRALAASQGLLIFRTSAEGLMLAAPGWEEITGQHRDEYLGREALNVVHPDDHERVADHRRACLAHGEAGDFQFRLRTRSGEWRWVRCQLTPVRRPSGSIAEWVGSIVDVHDHKIVEEQLRCLEEQLARVLDGASAAVNAPAEFAEPEAAIVEMLEPA